MNLKALLDWKTTLPGLLVLVAHYLISQHVFSPQIADIINGVLALAVGGTLIGLNTAAPALPAPPAAPAPNPAPEAGAPAPGA